eukprot:SM000028S10099  [mRNA]  locus=s28:355356:357003:- [translate_table: standard]
MALSGTGEAAPPSLAAAQIIQAGVVWLGKSEACLAFARSFARNRAPASKTRLAKPPGVQSSAWNTRKRKATMGVTDALMKPSAVPMKHARALQQPPALIVQYSSAIAGSDFATADDVASPPLLPNPPREFDAELDYIADHLEDLEANNTAATAAAGAASLSVMDLADFEGLLGVLSEVELEVDKLRDEYSSLWPASQTSQASPSATEHLDIDNQLVEEGIM